MIFPLTVWHPWVAEAFIKAQFARCAAQRSPRPWGCPFRLLEKREALGHFVPGDLYYLSPCKTHSVIGKQIENREGRQLKSQRKVGAKNREEPMKNWEELGMSCWKIVLLPGALRADDNMLFFMFLRHPRPCFIYEATEYPYSKTSFQTSVWYLIKEKPSLQEFSITHFLPPFRVFFLCTCIKTINFL